ncbi:Diaminohydroxyphosphoribosylamino-pyrimidine deaminase [Paramyrothecium foliicola]|nr:Diaminohydroxyphosphoribosylamino-pyrimidine deaminase [Paramyrothecium foliicola]
MSRAPTYFSMGLEALTAQLEAEIEDPEEETFLLYSQPIPSQNLGFLDPKAHSVDVAIGDRDFTLHQSPTVLSSNRAGGTTGAVLWKVTPLFAQWLASPNNILFTSGALEPSAAVILELGCGISPLNALALSPRVAHYVLSDQQYVQKLVQQNIQENQPSPAANARPRKGRGTAQQQQHAKAGSIVFKILDWETDEVMPSLTSLGGARSFDAVIACDCVFNYALVQPFVQTCVDVCRLRTADQDADELKPPCLCIVAQQLRNDEVFQSWLATFHQSFHAWRLPDHMLPEQLRSSAGFVVHIGVLRED